MGFFQSLKDDLSEAVGELIGDEELSEEVTEEQPMDTEAIEDLLSSVDALSAEEETDEASEEGAEETVDMPDVDLDQMLAALEAEMPAEDTDSLEAPAEETEQPEDAVSDAADDGMDANDLMAQLLAEAEAATAAKQEQKEEAETAEESTEEPEEPEKSEESEEPKDAFTAELDSMLAELDLPAEEENEAKPKEDPEDNLLILPAGIDMDEMEAEPGTATGEAAETKENGEATEETAEEIKEEETDDLKELLGSLEDLPEETAEEPEETPAEEETAEEEAPEIDPELIAAARFDESGDFIVGSEKMPIPEETDEKEERVTESMADVFEAEKEPEEVDEAQEDAKVAERVDALINDSLLLISEETAVITDGMKVTGDIMAGSHMNITGTVVGNIEIAGKLKASGVIEGNIDASELYSDGAEISGDIRCKGSVKIGQNSVIIGNVSGSCAVVAGAVKGDIDVRGPVILDSTAVVLGNIRSQSVQISTGAVIEGMCSQVYAAVNPSAFFEEFQKSGGRRKKGR